MFFPSISVSPAISNITDCSTFIIIIIYHPGLAITVATQSRA
jgi:hypothetical protein